MKVWPSRTVLVLAFTALPMFSATALALGTGPDTGPRVIPYQGRLELDGQAISSLVPMSFRLQDVPHDATPTIAHWSYDAGGVAVYGGAFSVMIGEQPGVRGNTPVPDWVFSAPEVYLVVLVNGEALRGSQRIRPVPYSYWTAQAQDLRVHGTLTADGLSVSGTSSLGAASASSLAVSGTSSLGTASASSMTTPSLSVSGASSLGTASASSVTTVKLSVTGAPTEQAAVNGDGYSRVDINDTVGFFYIDDNWKKCADNQVMTGLKLLRDASGTDQIYVQIECTTP